MGGISQVAFTIHDNNSPYETAAKEIIYMADIVLGWILLTLAFFYTFKPIIKFRIFSKRQISTINPRNSAVGIWYLLVTSLISVSYLSFMIYMFTKGFETPKIFRGPNSKAIDYIHRTVLILNQSLPPPNYILNLIGKIEIYATPKNTNNRNMNILDSSINTSDGSLDSSNSTL
ncbi:10777_t:CDS:2 [Entrophospora sp. SA101]|nr:1288_t:CDS:2 [Entrophospora sp. SA101]CAJ0760400.1 10777_t:CDS:2 [Entrophospora sp. SA101]CAJ0851958.1 7151_t:CDS:2 [Entrophospora sp. SA101]